MVQERHQEATRWAFLMASGTFLSRLLGLVRDVVIGAFFSRTETDVFFVAFRIPNFFRKFLGEGALSLSFVPAFSHLLADPASSPGRAKNFMNSVYTLILILTSTLTVLGILLMEPVLSQVFAKTPFAQVPGKLDSVILLARLLFLYLFLVTLYAYFMGIANALGKFFLPAAAPAALNGCIIVCAFLPKSWVWPPSLLLSFGVLAGGVIQVLLTGHLLWRLGFLPQPSFHFPLQDLKALGIRFFPGLLGVGGLALMGLLNLYFAGWLPEGTHTFIYYGDRLLELPRSLIAVSLGTALLPRLSQMVAGGQKQQMLDKISHHTDLLLFLILPCAVGFFYLGEELAGLLFQRGLFDSTATEKTGQVVKIYSALLVTSSLSHVLTTGFYAVKNTWYPALCVVFCLLCHILVTPFLVKGFALPGLVGATVLSHSFFMGLLALAYPFYVGRLNLLRSLKRLFSLVPLLLGLIVCLKGLLILLNQGVLSSWGEGAVLLSGLGILVLTYVGAGWWLKMPVALDFVAALKNRRSPEG